MRRELLIAGLGLAALLLICWWAARLLYPPQHELKTSGWWKESPPPAPEPFEPPQPEPVEDEPLLVPVPDLKKVHVCCCGLDGYGPCTEHTMSQVAARQHALRHDWDLFHRSCATAKDEAWALEQVLLRPDQVHRNTRNRLAMSDRAAWRQRSEAEAGQ